MKKQRHIAISGYNAGDFDEWWKGSIEKMEKRSVRKFGSTEDMGTLAPQRKGSRKQGRRGDTGNTF